MRYRFSFLASLFVGVILFAAGCIRVDDFLFENERVNTYLLDAYPHLRELPDLPAAYDVPGGSITQVKITSKTPAGSAVTIYGIYLGTLANINVDTVILYLHGNTKHIDHYWNRAKLLAHAGGLGSYGVLIIDYQGYGRSGGEPSEQALKNDARAAISWLQGQGLTSNRLVIYGYSMGSIPAAWITAYPGTLTPRILMLEAPMASIETMVQDGSGLALPGSYFTNLEGSVAEWIRQVNQPFLWMHGKLDGTVRWDTHGKVVYDNYGGLASNKQSVILGQAIHTDVPRVIGYASYANLIDAFIVAH